MNTNAAMKPIIFSLIKGTSIIVITAALGLEVWSFQSRVTQTPLFIIPSPAFWLAHIALTAHAVESAIAAVYASRQHKSPFSYAIYTFFVGTIGLIELFTVDAGIIDPKDARI